MTQPAVSLQIRELERRFGLQLIERLGKQAHATVPGRELVEAAQRIFRECDQVDATMRRFREGWIGRVRLQHDADVNGVQIAADPPQNKT